MFTQSQSNYLKLKLELYICDNSDKMNAMKIEQSETLKSAEKLSSLADQEAKIQLLCNDCSASAKMDLLI